MGGSELNPSRPVTRLATMMGDGQDLNLTIHRAVNKVKVKDLEHGTPNVWGKNNT